jgi:hypothetical protein
MIGDTVEHMHEGGFMSAKSHPGDGAKHQGEKGGNVGYVSHPSNSILGWSILRNLRKLWQIVKG